MRNGDDQDSIVVLNPKEQGVRESSQDAPANLVFEHGKGSRPPTDARLRFSDDLQESPSEVLAASLVETCCLKHLVIGLWMVYDLRHFNVDSAARARACTWLDLRALTLPLRTSS
jgi:hypothetical protein